MRSELPLGTSAPESIEVAIIGAGAAGLAASRQLSRMSIPHCILEQGQIGESWRSMPDALRLVSPWWANALALRDVLKYWPFSLISVRDYAQYLEDYARRFRPPVVVDCRVLKIACPLAPGERFVISTSQGDIRARLVVCATGYFFSQAPPVPPPDADGSVPVIHAAAFPGADRVAQISQGAPIVVVGRRVSAGQLMVELADHGLKVLLSTRSKVEFRRDDALGAMKDYLYYFYEEILMALRPELKAPSFPVMDGGRTRQLIASGQVKVVGPIASIRDGMVVMSDDTAIRAGLVINATGYRPAMSYLDDAAFIARAPDGLPACEGWESSSTPGLFFIGLDNRPNYRARTLRGIRRDCKGLARQLCSRLRSRLISCDAHDQSGLA